MIVHDRQRIADNIALAALFVVFFCVSIVRHKDNVRGVIRADPEGYYMYLPALFVYGGIHHLPDREFTGRVKNEKGESYTKYTCGVALFLLPFFLIVHLYTHIFHLDTSGYSPPYCYAIIVAGVLFAFVGLFFLKAVLLKYFNRTTTWLTLLCIMLGTNFYNYATLDMAGSHTYNFTLFAALILVAERYYKKPAKGKAMLLGLLMGWIVLTRPTNIVMIIFVLLFKVVSVSDFKERVIFFKTYFIHLLIALPFFIGILFPQLLYWKEMTGKWIKYSYDNEHFIYWNRPKIAEVLFDTQNGLLVYSPILLFLFWGLFAKRKDPRTNFLGTAIVFVLITYIFASWWAWWFGGAFGHRCYVDYYPMLAFPLAITMENLIGLKNKFLKFLLFFIIILFCYYSVALSSIYITHGIWDGPHWRWNWTAWWQLVRTIF